MTKARLGILAASVVAAVITAATPASAQIYSLGTGKQGFFTYSAGAAIAKVAAGDVELWRQILLDNRVHTLKALAGFEKVLSDFRAALEAGDSAALAKLLTEGKRNRDFVGN